MLFDTETQDLYTDKLKHIKRLCCPVKKDWNDLQWLGGDDRKRLCQDCRHPVINTNGRKDSEVHALVQYEPSTCLRVHVHPLGNVRPLRDGKYEKCTVIHTAWSVKAMNRAVKKGFFPLIMEVEKTDKIQSKLSLWQDKETGEVSECGDFRDGGNTDWVWFNPRERLPPFAAYLIPNDLEVGERVFLADLIEEVIESRWNQGDTYAEKSSFAVWNGESFELESSDDTASGFVG